MNHPPAYSYRASIKSDVSDELINTYVLRPLAGLLVWLLYRTRVTPNHVTGAAIVFGFIAAALYGESEPGLTLLAGLCLTAKDLLDSADGQLARAKTMYSRAGRFLDSIGDFAVNLAVFAAIGTALVTASHSAAPAVLALLAFAGISLRVSYHVYYQASYLHGEGSYEVNRTAEHMTDEDRSADSLTRALQKVYLVLYGWQDDLMAKVDGFSRAGLPRDQSAASRWYGDRVALRLSGFLGMGTELGVLTVCSLANRLESYLLINLIGLNVLWLVNVAYRRFVLAPRIRRDVGVSSTASSRPSSTL